MTLVLVVYSVSSPLLNRHIYTCSQYYRWVSIVQVLVPKDVSLLGKVVNVLITSAGKHYMKCSVISNVQPSNIPSPLPKGHISGVQAVPVVG